MRSKRRHSGVLAVLTSTAALVVGGVIGPAAVAAPLASPDSLPPNATPVCGNLADLMSPEQVILLDKIGDVSTYFFRDGDNLAINLTKSELKEDFGFSDEDYDFLQQDVLAVANGDAPTRDAADEAPAMGLRAACGGWYISHSDLVGGSFAAIGTAAGVGPEALAAAFVAAGSLMGGPIGTVITGGIALLGTAFFIDAGAKIVGAIAKHKGICITAKWGFPPLSIAIA